MHSIQNNLQHTLTKINDAAMRYVTPSPTLIAVSKRQPCSAIELAAQAGQLDFGENYVQEGVDKIIQLQDTHPRLVWHMIGTIQSNKTRLVAEHFAWVHTIDRLKIAQRLSEQRPANLPPLHVLLQINIDSEHTKSGVLPEDALALTQAIAQLPRLILRGLMCIPEKNSAKGFERMAQLHAQLKKSLTLNSSLTDVNTTQFNVLSMGMSQDFEDAIAHGASHVRIGTAIFGERTH
jgi:PLP dependent protein